MDTINIKSFFRLICIIATITLLVYCSLKFSRNESMSMVDFRSFLETEKDIYPSISLCFSNDDDPINFDGIYNKEVLSNSYGIEDPRIYIDFLEGNYWDSQLFDVDYDAVTINLMDYVEKIYIKVNTFASESVYAWDANQDLAKEKFPFRTTFRQAKTKCFSFDLSSHVVPDKRQNSERPKKIRQFAITIKSIASLNITLLYFAHYPNQLMRSSPLTIERLKHVGVISGKIMEKQFWLDNLEVIRRRNTFQAPCYEHSKDWDQYVISQMLDRTGCTPPQLFDKKLPNCTNNASMQKHNIVVDGFANPEFVEQFTEPCDEIQSISYNIEEFEKKPNTALNSSTDIFFLFKYGKYKDILHIQSFNVESLIGNMGGYIGLFLGFAIWQAPDAFGGICKIFKKFFHRQSI